MRLRTAVAVGVARLQRYLTPLHGVLSLAKGKKPLDRSFLPSWAARRAEKEKHVVCGLWDLRDISMLVQAAPSSVAVKIELSGPTKMLGISEPLTVAPTFKLRDEDGANLQDVASLDSIVINWTLRRYSLKNSTVIGCATKAT